MTIIEVYFILITAEPVPGWTKHFPKWQTSNMELQQIFQDFVTSA